MSEHLYFYFLQKVTTLLARNGPARDAGHCVPFRDCPGQSGTSGHPTRNTPHLEIAWLQYALLNFVRSALISIASDLTHSTQNTSDLTHSLTLWKTDLSLD